MIKTFCTDDHHDLLASADGRLFQFYDRADRLTKSASAVISRQDIQDHMPPDSHFGVHLISMATEEDFGPNINGDSTSRNALDKYHGTFEKYGCVFREHRNRDAKKQGVGQVKLARFNKAQGRGELLIWVDKEKAPDMWKAAKADKELSWSMSMRLPFDRCSICDHKSKTTRDYCKDLKNSMLKYVPEHRKIAYARNEDDIKLFDISEVKNRAERIATYLRYFHGDDMSKAAATGEVLVTGADWGDYYHGDTDAHMFNPWETLTLQKLAEAVRFVKSASAEELAVLAAVCPQRTSADWSCVQDADFRDLAGALAKQAMILPFGDFCRVIGVDTESDEFKTVEACELPGLIEKMLGGDMCGEEAASIVSPDDCGGIFASKKDQIDSMIDRVGGDLGMTPPAVKERTLTITIKAAAVSRTDGAPETDAFHKALALAYGCYLVKAAHLAKEADGVQDHVLFRGIAAMLAISKQNAGHGTSCNA